MSGLTSVGAREPSVSSLVNIISADGTRLTSLFSSHPPPSPPLFLFLLSGEHLRICPQGYTCCTSDMEDNLATLSRREMEGLLKNDGRSLHNALSGQHKAFDGECGGARGGI